MSKHERAWGRWRQDGQHLVCEATSYDVLVSKLVESYETVLGQLEVKGWFGPDDRSAIKAAYEVLREEHLREVYEYNKQHLIDDFSMEWCDDEATMSREWRGLLAATPPVTESQAQTFFERFPGMLPHPWEGHHGPCGAVVITQPEIRGIEKERLPDFMTMTVNSGEVWVGLIEIEAPGKKWFNQDGTIKASLTQAIDQLRDWQAQLDNAQNKSSFISLYRLEDLLRGRVLRFRYYLIYGRRAEVEKSETLSKKRVYWQRDDESFMTYDRLGHYAHPTLTCKLDRSGHDVRLRIVSIPPPFTLSRDTAKILCSCVGYKEAIEGCTGMSEGRRQYLLERLPIAEKYGEPKDFWHLHR